MAKTTIFRKNGAQVIRLSEDVEFSDGVREVVVFREGKRRVIVPADSSWDDFFEEAGIEIGEREQPEERSRWASLRSDHPTSCLLLVSTKIVGNHSSPARKNVQCNEFPQDVAQRTR